MDTSIHLISRHNHPARGCQREAPLIHASSWRLTTLVLTLYALAIMTGSVLRRLRIAFIDMLLKFRHHYYTGLLPP